jgi:hypothetical protein
MKHINIYSYWSELNNQLEAIYSIDYPDSFDIEYEIERHTKKCQMQKWKMVRWIEFSIISKKIMWTSNMKQFRLLDLIVTMVSSISFDKE